MKHSSRLHVASVGISFAVAACGSGMGGQTVDVDAPPTPETDASMTDAVAATGKRVFVTSLTYPADLRSAGGKATGRESADAICQTHADAVELGGTWRAWLSTSDKQAIDHIQGTGPWRRIDGVLAFANRATLGTTPQVPLAVDEKGGRPNPFYESWTGTALGGHLAPKGGLQSVTCLDWTSTIDSDQIKGVLGVYGEPGSDIDGTTSGWTNIGPAFCSPFRRHLYCFEQ